MKMHFFFYPECFVRIIFSGYKTSVACEIKIYITKLELNFVVMGDCKDSDFTKPVTEKRVFPADVVNRRIVYFKPLILLLNN